jgi:hypothetical protein
MLWHDAHTPAIGLFPVVLSVRQSRCDLLTQNDHDQRDRGKLHATAYDHAQ